MLSVIGEACLHFLSEGEQRTLEAADLTVFVFHLSAPNKQSTQALVDIYTSGV